eukprot:10093852-Alexandrium_andersonii.AAC.1
MHREVVQRDALVAHVGQGREQHHDAGLRAHLARVVRAHSQAEAQGGGDARRADQGVLGVEGIVDD